MKSKKGNLTARLAAALNVVLLRHVYQPLRHKTMSLEDTRLRLRSMHGVEAALDALAAADEAEVYGMNQILKRTWKDWAGPGRGEGK